MSHTLYASISEADDEEGYFNNLFNSHCKLSIKYVTRELSTATVRDVFGYCYYPQKDNNNGREVYCGIETNEVS